MELTIWHFLIVCPLVGIAGFVDSIAGGGGLISLPAYMLCGVPVHLAIGTNKFSSAMGTTVTTLRFAKNGYIPAKLAAICAACAVAGSYLGANLSLLVPEGPFQIIMLVVLPFTAFYVLKNKDLEKPREAFDAKKTFLACMPVALVIGAYDGFYGPGTGTFLLLLLTGLCHLTLREAAGITKVINLTTNLTSLCVFILNGTVLFPLGLAAGLFGMAGNYIGATFFQKRGAKGVRAVMLVVVGIFMIKLVYELLA